ncbi:V-type ATP synthase subunit I [Treponema pallidum]|nr:V-type ATP synthase subunit I [Treponema pallidum]UNO84457.1 V-type ATP synthase subunit I [Treponema pallidum]UNO85719.1 V-type ATP synthase subunit I [Treponema pallidum]WBP12295.1 V-type ATP synthase subunit I [Treponema pallidum]WER99082.1 V-type ATP synthase subunit I [Treponema pallidum]
MKFLELVVLERDVDRVLEYLGKTALVHLRLSAAARGSSSHCAQSKEYVGRLEEACKYLGVSGECAFSPGDSLPTEEDYTLAQQILAEVDALHAREREGDAPSVPRGKSSVAHDSANEEQFQGEKCALGSMRGPALCALLRRFALQERVHRTRDALESTRHTYRIAGWLPAHEAKDLVAGLDNVTTGRMAVRLFEPQELSFIRDGSEHVPVCYQHGRFVRSYERMVSSYGCPPYGLVDPTPFVAFSYALLFGIMFGDLGQGLLFFVLGLLLRTRRVRALNRWAHLDYVFLSVGFSSMVMGFLTGEFFAHGTLLAPLIRSVTALCGGVPRDHILHLMPSHGSLHTLMAFFGFTLFLGFVINSLGLIINIVNQVRLRHALAAVCSKTGVCGLLFFWYMVALAVRIPLFGIPFGVFDAVAMGVPLVGIFCQEFLERVCKRVRPWFPEGVGMYLMHGVIEMVDVVSGFFSNSMSFLRVGAFALSHAVLSFVVFTMTQFVGGYASLWGILVYVFGNGVIIFLEGLIVAIQAVRLQYYEFFSKFFTKSGSVFAPFRFGYQED